MKKVLCFGEVMMRFSPPDRLRFRQAMPGTMEVTFAGAEVNAAATLAALGQPAEFVTALPQGELAECCLAALRAAEIDVSRVMLREAGRFGLYFVESGANQRAGNVVYDRDGSTFGLTSATEYPWSKLLRGSDWFHTTGISAGVSQVAAEATLAAVRAAKGAGLTVSCDLNYRRKLWRWDRAVEPAELACRTLEEILPSVDVVMGNALDIAHAARAEEQLAPEQGADPDAAAAAARALAKRFPNLRWIAVTLRKSITANHHRWGALLLRVQDETVFTAPRSAEKYQPFDIPLIIDRIGTGDAFAGALIYALRTPELNEPGRALHFAAAASCLAHSVRGDFSLYNRAEVEALMRGGNGGMVAR